MVMLRNSRSDSPSAFPSQTGNQSPRRHFFLAAAVKRRDNFVESKLSCLTEEQS
jgi:hypothetical protein